MTAINDPKVTQAEVRGRFHYELETRLIPYRARARQKDKS